MSRTSLPLDGLTVLELGSRIAAVFCASILAEQGATVIKVEDPSGGDVMRMGNPFVEDQSLFFAVEDRNRKSVTLNLRHPQGQQLLRELAMDANVLCENFRPGTMEKWGLGPTDLNPELIYARVSAFGQDGPYSLRPGLDLLGISYGGLLHMTGSSDRPPVKSTVTISDHITGAFLAQAVTAALYRRRANPESSGEVIDASLYGSILRTLEATLAEFTTTGESPSRGRPRPFDGAPAGIFESSDGRFLAISAGSDISFKKLARALNKEEWTSSPSYSDVASRYERASLLNDELRSWVCAMTAERVIDVLRKFEVPVSPVNSPLDILDDPHITARNDVPLFSSHAVGALREPAPYPRFASGESPTEGSPALGEHNHEIWCERFGMSESKLQSMISEGII
jgi:crotonobetainyl-CoA:carnitine CoA-transferase CaiB-like acyl-CoA transferase